MVLPALIKNDCKLFLKDWKAVLLLLIMPFIFICLFLYALLPVFGRTSFMEPFDIALVDNENSAQTRVLISQLKDMGVFKEIIKVDESSALELIRKNEVAGAIIIPAEFSNNVAHGKNKPATVIGNKQRPLQSFVTKSIVESASNLVSAGQSAIYSIYSYNQKAGIKGDALNTLYHESTMKVFMEALARKDIFKDVTTEEAYNVTPAEYVTSCLIAVFLMFAGMPGVKMLVAERNSGIAARLASSGVKPWQSILSKFIVSMFLCLIQFLIVIGLSSIILKNYWGAPIGNILLLFTGIIFSISAWSVLVSSVSSTTASADVIGNLGILLMAVLGGSIYPISSMPEPVGRISFLAINKWAIDGFMILFSGNNSIGVTSQFLALAAIGSVMLLISMIILKLRKG